MLYKLINDQITPQLLNQTWSHWTALGVAGSGDGSSDGLIIDPEALLLSTLFIARRDLRLFDEVVDWLVINGDLINVSRMQLLTQQHRFHVDPFLLMAISKVLFAESAHHKRWVDAFGKEKRPLESVPNSDSFFQDLSGNPLPSPRVPDPHFLESGILRERIQLRSRSRAFPKEGAASLILQLRALIGMSSRCELLCLLLSRPTITSSEAALLTGYTIRTIQGTLAEMSRSSVIASAKVGHELHYQLENSLPWMKQSHSKTFRYPAASAIYSVAEVILLKLQDCSAKNVEQMATVALTRSLIKRTLLEKNKSPIVFAFQQSLKASQEDFFESLKGDLENLFRFFQ